MEFKAGDRVRMQQASMGNIPQGAVGTVLGPWSALCDTRFVAVYWDEYIQGHTCSGKCPDGYGWAVPVSTLELVDEEELPEIADASFVDILF